MAELPPAAGDGDEPVPIEHLLQRIKKAYPDNQDWVKAFPALLAAAATCQDAKKKILKTLWPDVKKTNKGKRAANWAVFLKRFFQAQTEADRVEWIGRRRDLWMQALQTQLQAVPSRQVYNPLGAKTAEEVLVAHILEKRPGWVDALGYLLVTREDAARPLLFGRQVRDKALRERVEAKAPGWVVAMAFLILSYDEEKRWSEDELKAFWTQLAASVAPGRKEDEELMAWIVQGLPYTGSAFIYLMVTKHGTSIEHAVAATWPKHKDDWIDFPGAAFLRWYDNKTGWTLGLTYWSPSLGAFNTWLAMKVKGKIGKDVFGRRLSRNREDATGDVAEGPLTQVSVGQRTEREEDKVAARIDKEIVLKEVGETEAEILRHRYEEGYPSKEVAERIGKSDGTIRNQTSAASRKIRDRSDWKD